MIASHKGKTSKIDLYIGQKLTRFRKNQGLSQEALARASGITFQQVQKYEKVKNRISAARLHEFSKILEAKLDDFFDGYEIP